MDRVLSYIACLRRSSSLSFIPLPPSNLRPFGAPPSIGRRECPHEPLPLEGAAERSEAGLASFLSGEAASFFAFPRGKALCREKRCSRFAAFPIGEGEPRQRWIGCSRKRRTRDDLPALFHTARTLSGSLCSPPSPLGKALCREKRYPRIAAFPIGEGGPRSGG